MSDPNYPQVPPTSPWPPTSPASPPWQAPPPPGSPWTAPPPQPVPEGGRRPPIGRLAAVAAGVLAVGGGAVFAASALSADGSGAATPEEAGQQLLSAVSDEDVLGVVDLLPAGERELLRDVTTNARDEYQRLGFLSEEFRLDGFPGVDIEITDPELDVEEVTDGAGPDDGLAVVTIVGGEASLEVDGDELEGNLGEVVEEVAAERDADLDAPDASEEIDLADAGISFAVVEEGGRWHPSVFFTIAELVRHEADLDEPDLDAGVAPDGADSPEEAVQALLDAGVALDAEGAIALLDPGEARALHVYSQYFLPLDAEGSDDVEIEATLTDADVDDLGGGVRRVVPTGLEVHFEADGGTGDIVLDDGCVAVDIRPPAGEGEPIDDEFCTGDDPSELELPEELGDVEVSDELREAIEAFQPLRFGIVTVERDGEHFVAPIRTAFDVVFGVTRGLEPDDLEEGGSVHALLSGRLDDDVEALFESAFETAFGFEELEDLGEDFEDFEDGGDFDRDECTGVGCGFDDGSATTVPEPTRPERVPTGASGPNGELVPGDAVVAQVAPNGVTTFGAVAPAGGSFLLGAEGVDGFDATIRVVDAATGEELAANDDANGFDPEVLLDLAAGQAVTVEVGGFAGGSGAAVVYFEQF